MAKIAVALEQALEQRTLTGAGGRATGRVLAAGKGWKVEDVICTHGPRDRRFEEQHRNYTIAMVVAGSFQYRDRHGHELMTPGSFVLGSTGQSFECGHEHGTGDRCIAFSFSPEYFEQLAAETSAGKAGFRALRVPPMRAFSPLVARACAGLLEQAEVPWEEISLQLAGQTLELVKNGDLSSSAGSTQPSSEARVTRALRRIERHIHDEYEVRIESLAIEAGLSPYHFLRTFERVTGTTPHQYILRMRLREAGMKLAAEPEKVLDIALDCGFGDVSNFNRAFKNEFGVSPRAYRKSV
ncbi:MAG TPA: AraC family transcriptional regulator [Candidatus Angelobacter sp.]|nr:AraC family transcriptional regulator [Candidatus Angelobacter sp.]